MARTHSIQRIQLVSFSTYFQVLSHMNESDHETAHGSDHDSASRTRFVAFDITCAAFDSDSPSAAQTSSFEDILASALSLSWAHRWPYGRPLGMGTCLHAGSFATYLQRQRLCIVRSYWFVSFCFSFLCSSCSTTPSTPTVLSIILPVLGCSLRSRAVASSDTR